MGSIENVWFAETVEPKGCIMYSWDNSVQALHDLLEWLDADHDNVISADDLANTTVKIAGFSSGCCSAAWITTMIDDHGLVVDHYTIPESYYTIETDGVPIAIVFNFDPVWYLFPWHGDIGKNVVDYYEYRQTKGGYGSFTPVNPADPTANNVVSAPFTGTNFGSNAAHNYRVNITSSNLTHTDTISDLGSPYTAQMLYTQIPDQCNHMTVPWIARGVFATIF